uniref:Uncharacterized protein n=1 Tax=Arundo donax TaxID=35708 RepID=A0A0A9HD51_ARUDO
MCTTDRSIPIPTLYSFFRPAPPVKLLSVCF